jgi:hypothetical protein
MKRAIGWVTVVATALLAAATWQTASGNGGPFVVKYPSGDPAAKGVLARLDPSLRPARETRLRVVEEKLSIGLAQARFTEAGQPPLAQVAAHYTIENPTAVAVPMDFGFPVLRGIYMNPVSMSMRPDVSVTVDGKAVPTQIISNSLIYGIIRQRAREAIDKGVVADSRLAALVAALHPAAPPAPQPAQSAAQQAAPPRPAPPAVPVAQRAALAEYLTTKLQWNPRDAALLVEYAAMDFGPIRVYPRDRWLSAFGLGRDEESRKLLGANLGPLAAISEQKATQFFAQLAGKFDRQAAAEYEAIFQAWGGDVRERSLDLTSGQLRPREFELPKDKAAAHRGSPGDVTVYARIDYLDEAKLEPQEKDACRHVLKNLAVTFTFAPMNLIYYQVEFPPKSRRDVVVSYSQYTYIDSRQPGSYQLSYVLHPASLWQDFGPIRIAVSVPDGIRPRASVAWDKSAPQPVAQTAAPARPLATANDLTSALNASRARPDAVRDQVVYQASLTEPDQKTGELFIAIDKAAWDQAMTTKVNAGKKADQANQTPPPKPVAVSVAGP